MLSLNPIYKKYLVTRIVSETADAKTFYLSPADGIAVDYKAGQFITFVFNTINGEKRRSYSISSSPDENDFAITVKRMENGEFSREMVDKLKAGDILYSSGISGLFILQKNINEKNDFIFFAAGSGITPCFSLIKYILNTTRNKIFLHYSSHSERDTIFFNRLNELAQSNPSLSIQYYFSRPENTFAKRLNKDGIFNAIHMPADVNNTEFYLCGPHDYMRMISISLLSFNISGIKIHRENFNDLAPHVIHVPPDVNKHSVTVRIREKEFTIEVQYPQTILASAKKNHVNIPYSCETGRCGSCIAKKTGGEIWMSYNEVLTEKDISEGFILTCQSFPVNGNATIELTEE
jgi:ring-1,2-phenylacetyl-CoA epoxidase subunit PaaE